MKKASIAVDTTPAKVAIVDGLTRDLSAPAAIQDLIDNAIDAAGANLRSRAAPSPRNASKTATVPASYSGYKIELTVSEKMFRIKDNSGGIELATLQKSALRFGQRSSHAFGIGIFGVGLNRALFKLGKKIDLVTDTGQGFVHLEIKAEEYLASESWQIEASPRATGPANGTSVEVTQLDATVRSFFSNTDEIENLRQELSTRYGRILAKGLKIVLNRKPVTGKAPRIRDDGPYPIKKKSYVTLLGVRVEMESGQHLHHRFAAEPDAGDEANKLPTNEYGWTVYCNDRAVLISNQDHRTGWDGKFHGEYNGFVGMVRFESADPSTLPWMTSKDDVDLNNETYQAALGDMRKFAADWKKHAREAKLAKRKNETMPPRPTTTATAAASKRPAKTRGAGAKMVRKTSHNESPFLLPDDINELYCSDKSLAVVQEAKKTDLTQFTYGGLMLLRVLFETALSVFLHRHGRLGELADFAAAERSKSGNPVDANDISASLDEGCKYLQKHTDLFGKGARNHLLQSLGQLIKHKKELNSCAHNPWQTISWQAALIIRDDAMPVLRHLIEGKIA